MKIISYSLLLAAAACGMALGQTAYTTPVGYVTQSCAANSDTIVGLPLRVAAVGAAALSAAPDTSTTPGSAILALSGTPGFTVNAFANAYYIKFSSGVSTGQWFVVTANTANTLTINLNGATLTAATADSLSVIKFWTLAELVNPATATTDPLTTPGAVVASTSTLASGRRTEFLIPNFAGAGINSAPITNYYVNGGVWKKAGAGSTSFDTDQLWPDTYFIIRNPSAVTSATTFTVSGEVDPSTINVPLFTQATIAQDNFIGLPRPVDVTLNNLGLGGTSAFLDSTSTLASGRRDELLTFDNSVAVTNKAPSANYYRNGGIWKKAGNGSIDVGTDVITAGFGFIIRKYKSGTGATQNWSNPPAY